ncbi:MAG: hypothetical protein HY738_05210 [Bacteroidia bacterium]|nr:hypothetical protein [Bacteroidia bacterium]
MEFVLNEWLPEYLRPETDIHKRKNAIRFLNVFFKNNDIIAIRRPSEFLIKIYKYAKQYQDYREIYDNYKYLCKIISYDSGKVKIIDDSDTIQLPDNVLKKLISPYDSDIYLFETAICTKNRIIITTDTR